MTLDQWCRNEKRTTAWRELMGHPLLVEGLAVLRDHFLHSHIITGDIAAHALQGAKRDGYFEFYQNMHQMTQFVPKPEELPPPWDWQKKKEASK